MIDLRSDTVTRPTQEMREVMARAEVGDDGFGEDPSVGALERRVAELLGKEEALFVPSGIMSNTIATLLHTRPGDEVIVGEDAHCACFEGGAGAAFAGVLYRAVGSGGTFSADDVRSAIRPLRDHAPRSSLVAVENTHNRGGGKLFPEKELQGVVAAAREFGLALHLDGARLWNAAVASGRPLHELAEPFDSVTVCFSKGLGAPVGSALGCSREMLPRARRFRKMLGGGMRQAGVLAAAALHAVERHRERLVRDHENAALIARELQRAGYPLDAASVTTNIVLVRLPAGQPERIARRAAKSDVKVGVMDSRTLRVVTHFDVSATQAETAASVLAEAFRTLGKEAELR